VQTDQWDESFRGKKMSEATGRAEPVGRANALLQLLPVCFLNPPNTEKLGGHMIGDDCRRKVALYVQRGSAIHLRVMTLIKFKVRVTALMIAQRNDISPILRKQLCAVAERADREAEFIEDAIKKIHLLRPPAVTLVVDNPSHTGERQAKSSSSRAR
jgi:hypothetical protein